MKKIILICVMILGVIGGLASNSYAHWDHDWDHHYWGHPYWGHPWGGWRAGVFWGGPSIVVNPWPVVPRPAYVVPPPVVVQEAPPVYIQRPPAPSTNYWYYCEGARAYYPYVKECPGGWMKVVPQPAPSDR